MNIAIEFFTAPDVFARLQNEWQTLLERSTRNTIFLTPVWQNVWWKIFHPGELILITARVGNQLVGVAPLYRDAEWSEGKRRLYIVGTGYSDYLDWIIADEAASSLQAARPGVWHIPSGCAISGLASAGGRRAGVPLGNAREIFDALFNALLDARMPPWDELVLTDLRANSLWLDAAELARAHGMQFSLAPLIIAPALTLPRDWETYLDTLDKKQRHELRRKLRRIEDIETRWYTVDARTELARGVDDFITLHEASSNHKAEFWDERLRDFFRALAYALHECGWLKLNFLEIQGTRAASAFTFDYANQILAYNSGYDPQRFGTYSPGVILFGFSIRDAIHARRATFDFLRGNEPYKYRFGAKDQQLYKIVVSR